MLPFLALDLAAGWWIIGAGVAVAVLGVAWFAIRFWLASTRPPNIQEINTPRLNRLNQQALEKMGAGDEDDEDEDAPEGLKTARPQDAPKS